ncbi:hypothetical protein ONS95_006361 [Cadophora gregata]|uniref:uncharacterized protein n=1 Tax=Cadophora gregata TaxID=51156 RepID=UPI0026DB8FB8|nr:uncharacterized protein ONS95_006361 [Cadophora gregata]KAK0099269.1 hypothetical protein ONS96_008503 [Cadophora gregata f. sp. sojae]KAK0102764.1 hypothetical protein ONS95_006361 [Cadophora gregata]
METTIQYPARTPNLETEKAFSTDFPVDHVRGAIRSNTQSDIRTISVEAIEDPGEWRLDVHGFCILQGEPHLDLEKVYTDKSALSPGYWYEIEAILHKAFPQYSRIEAFDFTARKRDPDFPELIRAYHNAYGQPSPVAHVDWSSSGSLTVLDWCFPGNKGFFKGRDFDMLNVWRLIRQPTDD